MSKEDIVKKMSSKTNNDNYYLKGIGKNRVILVYNYNKNFVCLEYFNFEQNKIYSTKITDLNKLKNKLNLKRDVRDYHPSTLLNKLLAIINFTKMNYRKIA